MNRWFILKPGMSDKAQGIRMFSTEEELYVSYNSLYCELTLIRIFSCTEYRYSKASSQRATTKRKKTRRKNTKMG